MSDHANHPSPAPTGSLGQAQPPADQRHPLYQAALDADQAYTDAIREAFGPRATRWTVTRHQQLSTPPVQAAYLRKISADEAWRAVQVPPADQPLVPWNGQQVTVRQRNAAWTRLQPKARPALRLTADQLMGILDRAADEGLITTWTPTKLDAVGQLVEAGICWPDQSWSHLRIDPTDYRFALPARIRTCAS